VEDGQDAEWCYHGVVLHCERQIPGGVTVVVGVGEDVRDSSGYWWNVTQGRQGRDSEAASKVIKQEGVCRY